MPSYTVTKLAKGTLHVLVLNTKTRYTLGGTLLQARRDSWPNKERFTFNFLGLTEVDKDALITFIIDNLGDEVTFVRDFSDCDTEQKSWIGKVISPSIPIEKRELRPCPLYNISFDFEGEEV